MRPVVPARLRVLAGLAALAMAAPGLAGAAGAPARELRAFSAVTVDGAPLRVDPAQHRVVIVHFWATWCAPCRVEMPLLDRVAQRYRIEVIGLALDAGASRARIRQAAPGIAFPLVRSGDAGLAARDVPSALPTTLVYGRDGHLRAWFGAGGRKLDEAALDQLLPALLAEQ